MFLDEIDLYTLPHRLTMLETRSALATRRFTQGVISALVLLGVAASTQVPTPARAQRDLPAAPQGVQTAPAIPSEAVAHPRGLPAIGKWMIDRDGSVADWLGEIYDGKHLHEPINVILVDAGATSVDDARKRLVAALTAAGYPVRFGHSTGYRGLIGGTLYEQIPHGRDDAFSNHAFEESNNHGRIFGPHRTANAYVFIGAFSREAVDLLRWPAHRYASFNVARHDLARNLDAKTAFKAVGHVAMDNAIADNPRITTGDHDGRAVLLRAR